MTKKNYTLITIFIGLANIALAQNPIPNAGFNNWNTVTYEVPNRWMSIGTVSRDVSKTLGNVTGFRLANDISTKTVSYAMQVGNGYPDKLTGGFAINGTPNSIRINYNSEKLGNDTAIVILGFTKGADPIPMVLQEFFILADAAGTGDNSITVPLTYSYPTPGVVADSAFIYISSSLRKDKPNSNGSIAVYDISFPGGQTSSNGNLNIESWGSLLVRKPNQWTTSLDAYEEKVGKISGLQEYILSSSESRTGMAALLTQRSINTAGGAEKIPAWMITRDTNLNFADMGTPSFAVNQRYNSIRGYWKGALTSGDRATVMVNFFHADTLVGSGMFSQDSKTTVPVNYMMFAENIVWDSRFKLTPTKATLGIFLTDSSFQEASNAGSQIWFEDLWLDQNFASTKPIAQPLKTTVNCYPNPTKGKATITAEDNIERVVVFNTAGQVVFAESLTVKSREIYLDFCQFAQQKQAGLSVYFVRIETQRGMSTASVVVEP